MKSSFKFTRVKVVLITLLSINVIARAAPQGAEVLDGNADIVQNGNKTTITQQSDETVIQWQSFDVEQSEKVEFVQPNTDSVVINNIVGGQASFINGEITANGQVVLINNQGFVFTGGSFLQADSLTLAAADLSQDENGKWLIQSTGENAKIINAGQIEVQNGHLVLLANQVINTGEIINHFGDIKIIADQGGFYGLDPKGITYLALPQEMVNTQSTLIDQSGTIKAEKGDVNLNVISRDEALDAMLKHSGQTTAGALHSDEGEAISFESNYIELSGLLSADSILIDSKYSLKIENATLGQQAQSIELNANTIDIKNSVLDASHSNNGGSVKIGGMHLDKVDQAQTVNIDEKTIINVSSNDAGNAGEAIIWSKTGTNFKGTVYAMGGSESGNGGFVEVSAKKNLHYDGFVDTTAAQGEWGTLLLDPDIIIITDGNTGPNDDQLSDGIINENDVADTSNAEDGTTTYTISEEALEAASGSSNVSLYASQKIIIEDLSDEELNLSQTGDVTFEVSNDDVTKNNGSASIVMEDKNDTIIMTGAGALNIRAFGQTNTDGEVIVDIGNVTNTEGNILITAEQVTNGTNAPDTAGTMNITTGNVTAEDGGITIRATNNTTATDSGVITVSLGDIEATESVAIQQYSHSDINVTLQKLTATNNTADGLQATLLSGTNNGTLIFNDNITTHGSNINIESDNVTLTNDVILNSLGEYTASGDIYLAGVGDSFDGQNHNLTLNTGTLTNLNIDWLNFSNIQNVTIESTKNLAVSAVHEGASLNFTQEEYVKMADASSEVTFSTTGSIVSTGLAAQKNVTLIADSDGDGDGALTLTNFTSTNNASLGLVVDEDTDLTNLDLGTGTLNLIALNNASMGFGDLTELETTINFSQAQIDSWTLSSVTSSNAGTYEVSNLDTDLNFTLGDGSQTITLDGDSNTFASIDVNGSVVNLNSDVSTTDGDITVNSASTIGLAGNLNSADSIQLEGAGAIQLGEIIEINATNSLNTTFMTSTNTTDLTLSAGTNSKIGGLTVPGANLTINFDNDATTEGVLILNWDITAENIVIESQKNSGSAVNDVVRFKGNVAAQTMAINGFMEIDANSYSTDNFNDLNESADIAIVEAIDFSAMTLTASTDFRIEAGGITLGEINSDNDSSLKLVSTQDVTLNSVDLGLGNLNIDVDSTGALVSNAHLQDQVDVGDLSILAQQSSTNTNDDLLEMDANINTQNFNVEGFEKVTLNSNINSTEALTIDESAIFLTTNLAMTGNEVTLDNITTNNNANLTITTSELLTLKGVDLGAGSLIIHLDENAGNTAQASITGALVANDILIEAQNNVNSTLNDQLNIDGTVQAETLEINNFSNVSIDNDITLTGDLDIDGLNTDMSAQIVANAFNYTSQDTSVLQLTGETNISVNDYSNNAGISSASDLELSILNPSATVNLENIILTGSDLTLNIQNIQNVSVDKIGADNITLTNDMTAALTVGEVVDNSALTIDGFNDVTFIDNVLLASLDVDTVGNMTQTDGSKIETAAGIIDINAGGSIYVTQIESENVNSGTVILVAGGNIEDVNDTQVDFVVDNQDVLNITAGGNVPEFQYSYDTTTPVDPPVIDPPVVVPEEPKTPTIVDESEVIQEQVDDALNQPEEDSDKTEEAVEKTNESRVDKQEKSLDAQFEQCDEQDKNCEKQKAVQSFLGRLLIGGELPE